MDFFTDLISAFWLTVYSSFYIGFLIAFGFIPAHNVFFDGNRFSVKHIFSVLLFAPAWIITPIALWIRNIFLAIKDSWSWYKIKSFFNRELFK